MSEMKEYRMVGVLMNKTGYGLWEVCAFLNAHDDFWYQGKEKNWDYARYMKKYAGLTREKLKNLNRAHTQMINEEPYPLEKEFALMSNTLADMDDAGFEEYNPELYKEAEDYFNVLCEQILQECSDRYADHFQDLMKDGKIRREAENTAIRRYMVSKGYHCPEVENMIS